MWQWGFGKIGPQIAQITQRSGATTKLGYSQYHIAVACGFAGVTGLDADPHATAMWY
jgi:hypothetical protein